MPPAWQYPEITCARITLDDREFRTVNFAPSPWQQTAAILVHGEQSGTIQVVYLQEKPAEDEGSFLKEERSLIAAIAEHLGGIIERKQVEAQLRIIQEALTNVGRHAGVETAQLLFTLHPDVLQAMVDSGSGFSPTLDPRSPTSSFGLQIMRERAESVGGSLEVRSAPGQGTGIVVRLPLSLTPADDEAFGRGLRVLLVDDHPLYPEGLRNLLSTRGVHVVGLAHDGLQAQSMAQELLPDLILMDVEMPHCDGLEATRHMNGQSPAKTLSERLHCCPHCGFTAPRDVNAALNSLSRGRARTEPPRKGLLVPVRAEVAGCPPL